jgi:soluble lytic murein transglycosylase
MQFPSILASTRRRPRSAAPALVFSAVLALAALLSQQPAAAQNSNTNDDVLTQMKQAFQRGDKGRLTALLPQARGHALEPWAAYWELKARLQEAAPNEVQDFFARYPGTYQEDRLRNDWLLLLGQRRDWDGFSAAIAGFRMGDDAQVRCYAILADTLRSGTATQAQADEVRRNWFSQKEADDGCLTAADRMVAARLMSPNDAWKKARLAIEASRPAAARGAVTIAAPDALPLFEELNASSAKFLTGRAFVAAKSRKELVVLALVKVAIADPEQAASQLDSKWGPMLSAEERNWLWGTIGRAAANKLGPQAGSYFANVTKNSDLSDDMLGWRVRAALRAGQWKEVAPAINAMSDTAQQDPTWVYWKARALASERSEERRAQARELYTSIAGSRGFYEMLALEELGQRTVVPTKPAPLTPEEKAAARSNLGLNRGLYAIAIGLRDRRHGASGTTPPTCTRRAAWATASCWPPPSSPASARCGTAASTPASAPRAWSMPTSASRCRSATGAAQAQPGNRTRPGLRVRPDPAGKPLHHGRQARASAPRA